MTCAEAKSVIGNLPIRFVGGDGGSSVSALFYDQRDDTWPGAMGTALKWWTRLFNTQNHNDISSNIELLSWVITEANTVSNYFKVAGDQTTYFPAGHRFDVRASTGNDSGDTPYIVASSVYAAGFTTINVTGNIVDATADGTIHNGMFKFLTAKKYNIEGALTCYGIKGTDVRLVNISGVTFTAGYVSSTPATMTDPLSAAYAETVTGACVVTVNFKTQINPSINSVWEVQQWNEYAAANVYAMGTHKTYPVGTSHGGVVNFAHLEIKAAL